VRSHVNLLGLLHLTWGGIGLLLGVSLLLLAFGAAAIARAPGSDPLTAGATALLFVVFATANHYVLDAVAGAALGLAGLRLARALG